MMRVPKPEPEPDPRECVYRDHHPVCWHTECENYINTCPGTDAWYAKCEQYTPEEEAS